METILGIIYLIFSPWILLWETITGTKKQNSGHTAGIGQGLLDLFAVAIGVVEVLVIGVIIGLKLAFF